MKKMGKVKKIIVFVVLIIITAALTLILNPGHEKYAVKGVDVSVYQGNIDWEVLSKEGISFAFIKATEGSNFVDEKFKTNYENAYKTDLFIGAYHFFSYDSEGETQAENFIKTVPKLEGTLAPVVDVEFYDANQHSPHDRAHTKKILKPLLDKLEEHYGKKPIIYATPKSYYLYLAGDYKDYPIWIRNTMFNMSPLLLDFRSWTFWQYSDTHILNGYSGDEKHIDMNVFKGTKKDLENFIK